MSALFNGRPAAAPRIHLIHSYGDEKMPLFEVTENDRRIYEKELKDFLPDKILDVHTHVWLDEYTEPLPADEELRMVLWPKLVAKDNSVEDLQETYRLMFPGKEVSALMFTSEVHSIESGRRNNEYVAKCSKKTGWPALYYSHPKQSADEVEKMIRDGGFLGIKSYLSLSPSYIPEAEIRIFDFFPKEQLKRMDEMGASVMHIGRAYVKEDVGNAFTEYLYKVPDLMYDFTANCCEYAITECIRHAGAKHLMFGTDMPILRMRTHRIEENGTYINLIPPGLYGDPKQDRHLREVSAAEAEKITFFAYEELLALKRACKTLGCSKEDVADMMYNNAKNLIDGAKADIYGK